MKDNFFSKNDLVLISNDHKYNLMIQVVFVKENQKHTNYVIGIDEKGNPCFDKIILLKKPHIAVVVDGLVEHYFGRYFKVFLPSHETLAFVRYEQLIRLNGLLKIVFE